MKYLCLVYVEEKILHALPNAERLRLSDESMSYCERLQKLGQLVTASPLHPVETATTVRVRDGKTSTIDGPFAETKEQLWSFISKYAPGASPQSAPLIAIPKAWTPGTKGAVRGKVVRAGRLVAWVVGEVAPDELHEQCRRRLPAWWPIRSPSSNGKKPKPRRARCCGRASWSRREWNEPLVHRDRTPVRRGRRDCAEDAEGTAGRK